MGLDIDAVDWSGLEHNYGAAEDVPDRALLDARDRWQSVAAAHALWTLTGDVAAGPILLAATDGLADGRYLPVMPVAVNHLAALGPAAA